jgi:hypothetical protein
MHKIPLVVENPRIRGQILEKINTYMQHEREMFAAIHENTRFARGG